MSTLSCRLSTSMTFWALSMDDQVAHKLAWSCIKLFSSLPQLLLILPSYKRLATRIGGEQGKSTTRRSRSACNPISRSLSHILTPSAPLRLRLGHRPCGIYSSTADDELLVRFRERCQGSVALVRYLCFSGDEHRTQPTIQLQSERCKDTRSLAENMVVLCVS
jgi:hypothetical protein